MKLFWISFCNAEGNLGVVITEAPDETAAVEKCTQLGINPGGEAALFDMSTVPDGQEEASRFKRDVLIKPEELRSIGYRSGADINPDDFDAIMNSQGVTVVCDDCNKPK